MVNKAHMPPVELVNSKQQSPRKPSRMTVTNFEDQELLVKECGEVNALFPRPEAGLGGGGGGPSGAGRGPPGSELILVQLISSPGPSFPAPSTWPLVGFKPPFPLDSTGKHSFAFVF